ncbi:HNH endonuclease [Georgenia alba]|uniref:DUF222 domain-containing protein n=1 Tax=Georgenia alba TaxID=2233858 RepID=A0ABW2Q8U1_9MICO
MTTATMMGLDSDLDALSVADRVALAERVLASLTDTDLQGLGSRELLETLDGLERVERRLDAVTMRALVAAETDGMWATSGARSFPAWYAARTGRYIGTARSRTRTARRLRDHLRATAEALEAGTITTGHAEAMARHAVKSDATRARLTDERHGESFLLEHAGILDAGRFNTLVRRWATAADPDMAERAWREESGREEVTLAPTLDGYHLQGWLSTESGQVLAEALEARTGVPAAGDDRTPAQRRADALVGLARLGLDSGVLKPGARVRPHLAVHVPYETLTRLVQASKPTSDATGDGGDAGGTVITAALDPAVMVGVEPATLPDGSPLAPGQLARLACSSGLHRVIFGPDGEVLDSGREERLFTAGQTRAIVARDRHCQYPGCHAPPGEGEIHHCLWWYEHGGGTSTANGVLVCWHHHDQIHQHHLTIRRDHGTWVFTRPDGSRVAPLRLV